MMIQGATFTMVLVEVLKHLFALLRRHTFNQLVRGMTAIQQTIQAKVSKELFNLDFVCPALCFILCFIILKSMLSTAPKLYSELNRRLISCFCRARPSGNLNHNLALQLLLPYWDIVLTYANKISAISLGVKGFVCILFYHKERNDSLIGAMFEL